MWRIRVFWLGCGLSGVLSCIRVSDLVSGVFLDVCVGVFSCGPQLVYSGICAVCSGLLSRILMPVFCLGSSLPETNYINTSNYSYGRLIRLPG